MGSVTEMDLHVRQSSHNLIRHICLKEVCCSAVIGFE